MELIHSRVNQLIPITTSRFKDRGHLIFYDTILLNLNDHILWTGCYCLFFYTCRYYQYLPRNPKKMFLWSLAKTFGSNNKVIHCQVSCIIDFRHSWIPGVFKLEHLFHQVVGQVLTQIINHNPLHNLWLICIQYTLNALPVPILCLNMKNSAFGCYWFIWYGCFTTR